MHFEEENPQFVNFKSHPDDHEKKLKCRKFSLRSMTSNCRNFSMTLKSLSWLTENYFTLINKLFSLPDQHQIAQAKIVAASGLTGLH